ncbi:hypothetical protein Tco_0668676 [Tanacetum coccineum]
MGGSSSQPRTDRVHSPINAFSLEDLYTPAFSDSFQENTAYWQETNPYEVPVEQVATSPTKKKKLKNTSNLKIKPRTRVTRGSKVAFGLRFCRTSRAKHSSIDVEQSGKASINLNTNVGDNDEDEVQETQRPQGRDKAKGAGKKKGSKSSASASASSNVNEDALARLMVTEMTAQEKQERLAFLDIKWREAECLEQEIEQQDTRLYLQQYNHLTGDQRKAMDAVKARIKAKYNLE